MAPLCKKEKQEAEEGRGEEKGKERTREEMWNSEEGELETDEVDMWMERSASVQWYVKTEFIGGLTFTELIYSCVHASTEDTKPYWEFPAWTRTQTFRQWSQFCGIVKLALDRYEQYKKTEKRQSSMLSFFAQTISSNISMGWLQTFVNNVIQIILYWHRICLYMKQKSAHADILLLHIAAHRK